MSLGELIEHLGLGQAKFADKLGFSPSYVSGAVNGYEPVEWKLAEQIMETLECSVWGVIHPKWDGLGFVEVNADNGEILAKIMGLRELIRYLNQSQKQFADNVGLSRAHISGTVNRHRPVGWKLAERIMEALEYSVWGVVNPKQNGLGFITLTDE